MLPILLSNAIDSILNDECQYGLVLLLNIEPILQVGPQCGLVALTMAGQLLNDKVRSSKVSEIFNEAKKQGFTLQGEIFSATWLATLAKSTLSCESSVLEIQPSKEGYISSLNLILKVLLKSKPILFPYDCDKNHTPCKKNGHSAHWAILIGFLIVKHENTPPTDIDFLVKDQKLQNLFWIQKHEEQRYQFELEDTILSIEDVFLMGLHGKSRHSSLWTAKDLFDSNGQMMEIGEHRSDGSFVIPADGLADLRGKFVVLG